jgi:hypothetical protein
MPSHSRFKYLLLLGILYLSLFALSLSVHAACLNPSPITGFALPCPVFSVSSASLSQASTLTLTATPQAGTDYIYTTAYYAKNGAWVSFNLSGTGTYMPTYSSTVAMGSLDPSILAILPQGTNYVVTWDWL